MTARSQVVIKRKQELDENTIKELTKGYSELFVELQEKQPGKVYKNIQNYRFENTISMIIKEFVKVE